MRILAAVLLVIASCSQLPFEEGSIDVRFCQVEDCAAWLAGMPDASCVFYDLDAGIDVPARAITSEDSSRQVLTRPSAGLLHHKFCVNATHVLTGSANPTINGLERNDNNLVLIESRTIAGRYRQEFEDLLSREHEGDRKSIKSTRVNVSGSVIEVHMCPQEDCEDAMLATLERATRSVHFMAFTFTSDPIGDELLWLHRHGVSVEGVVESRQGRRYAEHPRLSQAGVDVITDGNPAVMHHKVFIVDEHVVITGSFNPTASANERNDENLLIIEDERIAAAFLEEYRRVRRAAEDI